MSTTIPTGQNQVVELLREAHEEGSLSAASLSALTIHADMGTEMQSGLGISVDDVPASDVFLLTEMADDSGSISAARAEDLMREAHNRVIAAVRGSRSADGMLFHSRLLNGKEICPFVPITEAVELDTTNYRADKGTPLYDQVAVIAGTVLAKSQAFARANVPVRTYTVILTDGLNEHSTRFRSPDAVRPIIEDMLAREHIFAAIAITDGTQESEEKFRRVFQAMGFPDRFILTPAMTESEIREAVGLVSRSAMRASQSHAGFSQAKTGGFGA